MTDAEPGDTLLLGEHMDAARGISFVGGEAQVYSRRTPAALRANEDGALLLDLGDGRGVLAVADGMGGAPRGDLAAAIALESLRDVIRVSCASGAELREAILDGIETANRRVLERAPGSGATIAVVQYESGKVRTHHVGDAAALVCGQRGRLKHSASAHSPVGYALQAGVLSEDEAMVHEQRHVVSNAIGTSTMHIEVGPQITLSTHDTVVVASDGVIDNLRIEEVVEIVRCGPLARAAQGIAQRAGARMQDPRPDRPGKPDDCTFVLFRPMARQPR